MVCSLCKLSPTGECEFCRIRKEIYSVKKLDLPRLNPSMSGGYTSRRYMSEGYTSRDSQEKQYGLGYKNLLTFKVGENNYSSHRDSPYKGSDNYQKAA